MRGLREVVGCEMVGSGLVSSLILLRMSFFERPAVDFMMTCMDGSRRNGDKRTHEVVALWIASTRHRIVAHLLFRVGPVSNVKSRCSKCLGIETIECAYRDFDVCI